MTAVKYGDMGRDQAGFRVWRGTADVRVSECCGADAKGVIRGGQPATVCRRCYQPVPVALGGQPQPPYTRNGRVTATIVKGWAQYATT